MIGFIQVVNQPEYIPGIFNALLGEFDIKALVQSTYVSDHDTVRAISQKHEADCTITK